MIATNANINASAAVNPLLQLLGTAAAPQAGVAAPTAPVLSPLQQLIQTLIAGNLPMGQAIASVGQLAATSPQHFNNLSMVTEQAARLQDNNGNQITGASIFNGNEELSTAAFRMVYGMEGFFNRGERDQNGNGGQGFSPLDIQQFATYYASDSPGKAVLDFYPFLKQEGANYNSDDIEDEMRRIGLDDLADKFNDEDSRNTDVTRMHYLMTAMDLAKQRGLEPMDLTRTVDNTGREVLADLRDPESDRAQEFAQQKANKAALLYDPSVVASQQMLTGEDATFNNLQNGGNRRNAQFDLFSFPPPGVGVGAGVPAAGGAGVPAAGVAGAPPTIQAAVPQLDLNSLVYELANQMYSAISAGVGTPTTAGVGGGGLFSTQQANPNFGNFNFGEVVNAGTLAGSDPFASLTIFERMRLGLPV